MINLSNVHPYRLPMNLEQSPALSLEAESPSTPASSEKIISLNTSDRPYLQSDTRLGYAVIDLSGSVQASRGKENKIYHDVITGQQYFAKYIDQQSTSRFDDIQGIAKEKRLLDHLASTGVVPRTSALRIYPSQRKARLLMEVCPGQSFDNPQLASNLDLHQKVDVIMSTAESLQKVRQAQVVVGDLNPGTFLVDTSQSQPSCTILDLEIGQHLADPPQELAALASWCSAADRGARLSLDQQPHLPTLVKQIEVYRWAKVMAEWLLGDQETWTNADLNPQQEQELQSIETYLGPSLRQDIEQRLRHLYDTYYRSSYESHLIDETVDQFIQAEIGPEYAKGLTSVAPSVYFEAQLDHQQLNLPTRLVHYLKQCLQANPSLRPTNFQPLLSPL